MPYVDDGQPKPPSNLPPILPAVLAMLMACVGAAAWLGCYKWFGMSYPGALVAGLLVGLSIKLTLTKPIPQFRVYALILTALASIVGFIGVFAVFFTNFTIAASITSLFRDIVALLFIGVGCYIAFALAAPRSNPPTQEGRANV